MFREADRQYLFTTNSDVAAPGALSCRDSIVGQEVRLARLGIDEFGSAPMRGALSPSDLKAVSAWHGGSSVQLGRPD
jgi:hypothetical protein